MDMKISPQRKETGAVDFLGKTNGRWEALYGQEEEWKERPCYISPG